MYTTPKLQHKIKSFVHFIVKTQTPTPRTKNKISWIENGCSPAKIHYHMIFGLVVMKKKHKEKLIKKKNSRSSHNNQKKKFDF